MNSNKDDIVVLMVEDDEDDCLLLKEAFSQNDKPKDIRFVHDGEEFLDYVYARGKFQDRSLSPRPDLILLDLNLPKKDGREALREIKSDKHLRSIPIVVLTTSDEERDIVLSYELGANSFITKPMTFEEWRQLADLVCRFWFDIVLLPPK